MHNLIIVFELPRNQSFHDNKETGSRGNYIDEWHCAMTDKQGWPIVGLTVNYFRRKPGCKPIRILNEGPVPKAWKPDQVERVMDVLNWAKSIIPPEPVDEPKPKTKRRRPRKSVSVDGEESPQTLPTEGGGGPLVA